MEGGGRKMHINPDQLRFTLQMIPGQIPTGETIDNIVLELRRGGLQTLHLGCMAVIDYRGILWCLNNRQLWVYRAAGVPVAEVDVLELNDPRIGRMAAKRISALLREFQVSPQFFDKMASADFFPDVAYLEMAQPPDVRARRFGQLFDADDETTILRVRRRKSAPAREPEQQRLLRQLELEGEPQVEPETEPTPSRIEAKWVEDSVLLLSYPLTAPPALQNRAINVSRDHTSVQDGGSVRQFGIFLAVLSIAIPTTVTILKIVRNSRTSSDGHL